MKALKVRGVVNFVGNHRGPVAVPDKDIENIRALVSRGADCSPHPLFVIEVRVRVVHGALAGIEGTLVRFGARSRLVVSVEIIQRGGFYQCGPPLTSSEYPVPLRCTNRTLALRRQAVHPQHHGKLRPTVNAPIVAD